MWNAPKNVIPEGQIRQRHLGVIKAAVQDAEEYDIRDRKDLAEALDYMKRLSPVGVRNFQRGLQQCSLPMIAEATYAIERLI